MCVGENCAPQAVHYMNAQLTALYENALSCVKEHDVAHKHPEQTKYSHALAEYSYIDPDSRGLHTMFKATFDKPSVEFICNHDAVLRLKIHKGFYRLDYTKASNMTYAEKDRIQSLHEVDLAFRVPYDIHGLRGKDHKIGNGQNVIKMVILDLLKAELVSVKPAVIIGRDAFVHYLEHYLSFLHHAGNHVLFSLPDFDDDRYRLTIDYSLMGGAVPEVAEVHGISVEKINTYLSSVWLKAAMLLGGPDGITADWKQTVFAEYRSTWSQHVDLEVHYAVRLGAPRIKPICSREVVLYFAVDEVSFYTSTDFEVYSGWEIAILVDVIYEVDSSGHATRCILDLSTARPYNSFCKFAGLEEHDEIALSYCTTLLEFFTSGYLDIMESVDFHVIYHNDTRWVTVKDDTEFLPSWTADHETTGAGTVSAGGSAFVRWTETVTTYSMHGFDQITAISQSSINALFASLHEQGLTTKAGEYAAVLSQWAHEEYFSASFKPITVRLLSNGRAIVWIHLEKGHLKTLRNWQLWHENEKYDFDGWHLAFEVDIKKQFHHDISVSDEFRHKYKESAVFKQHGQHHSTRLLEHIYLDLETAEFLHEFSSFEGLFQKRDHRPIDKVQAAVHYIKSHYLPHLAHWGLHILYTVPIWHSGTLETLPSCSLTSIAYHIYSKTQITRHTWAHVAAEPAIVILGMIGFRSLPSTYLDAKSAARWEAYIVLQSDLDGLKVAVVGSPAVKFEKTKFEGDTIAARFTDLHTNLQAHLPPTIDLADVLRELRVFEGVWHYGFPGTHAYALANPVFTRAGDILFELRLHGNGPQSPSRTAPGFRLGVGASPMRPGSISRSSSSEYPPRYKRSV
ncbi:hypothetical protein POSPLADRAFT_1044390 [Postia placenta MAD-698-R-SB12]|uniref:Uncharacterized protein n=1 Tax=Postia placenta MAD-698-R-SB12 TaxID=670580 RepID=A0A1X6N8J2_9APHY|nr:hypothetical protein POSPLADRAFT_1044390 [Postia placenta MAD-698-R-SB12]OSX64959.1 hypothetical protein POSPLADRAFT_1044390 [Postia placenta MAD-698-R-SB12]